jgi:group I intron endonuclease
MEERNYCVYKHTSPYGKVYIGMTCQEPTKRWKYGWGYKNNQHFDSAIQKYGWNNFEHEILYTDLTQDQASVKEQELIEKYQSNNPEFGYNISSGGYGGREGVPQNDEAKRKISEANKGRLLGEKNHLYGVRKYREENPFYGKHHTEETKEKLSKIHKGTKHTEEAKQKISKSMYGKNNPRAKKVLQYDLDMNLIQVWDYVKLAAKTLNIVDNYIIACCKGNKEAYKGYIWKYADTEN